MKRYSSIFFAVILVFSGCRHTEVREPSARPRAIVTAVSFRSGEMTEELPLQAQSVYLVRNSVNAPVNCFVRQVFISPGNTVTSGQVLFEIATRERNATEKTLPPGDSTFRDFGLILIRASGEGIISSVSCHVGDFISEGSQMCQISPGNSFAFKLHVPFEYNSLVKTGGNCKIEMTDGRVISGIIDRELDQMSLSGQTRQYIVKPLTAGFIPENLLATIKITIKKIQSNQILPAGCVLSDEMMQNFWVMKLINDSVAVRINVKTGLRNRDEIEITEPLFKSGDLILSSGNYGLADTALVKIEM